MFAVGLNLRKLDISLYKTSVGAQKNSMLSEYDRTPFYRKHRAALCKDRDAMLKQSNIQSLRWFVDSSIAKNKGPTDKSV